MDSLIEDYLDLERRAVETPRGVALAARAREPLSWAGLWAHTQAADREFARAGITPHGVAALALPSGAEFISAFLAITLRAACAPLDLSLTADEYRFYLSNIKADALVFAEGVNPAVVEVGRQLGMRLIRIHTPEQAAAGVLSIELLESGVEDRTRRESNAAVLLHTSATTNIPKLVPLSRANLRAAAQQDFNVLGIGDTDRYLSLTPLCHAHGLVAGLTQLYCGGGVFCDSAFSAEELLESLQKFRPTWLSAGVPVVRTLLALARENPEAFRGIPLRFIRSTGASPDAELADVFQQVAGVPLLNGYGLTELCGVTRNTLSRNQAGSAGISSGSQIEIRDDAGNVLPAEMEGEIVIRGPALTSGYLDDPQANLEAFRDGWFHTGDIGRMDGDGFLFIAGRKKEMISRGGKKILPLEVDSALLRHPGVADAATFPIPHRTLEQEPAAAVVLRPGAEVSALELRRFAATHLAAYKVPRKIVFLDEIPRATTGKPKRAALSEQFRDLGAPAQSSQREGPASEIEETLLAIWRRVLNMKGVRTSDDFFDLGGDSLSAAHMLTQAAAAFQLGPHKLPEADFFEQPTISALALSISEHASQRRGEPTLANSVLVLESQGTRLPIFCFSTGEHDAYQFRHLSRWLGPEQPFTVVCPGHPMQHGRLRSVQEIARQSVTSIRALRPHGPYLIGGHCYGGLVAFEACRQLIADGESIAVLLLFDTPTPGYPKIKWKVFPQAVGAIVTDLLRGRKAATFGKISEHSSSGPEDRPAETWHPALMGAYQPSMLTAPIVHFLGAGVNMSTRVLSDPRMGWRDFAGGGFEAHRVPGDHVSIFSELNAPVLAAELENTLQDVNVRSAIATA